MLNFIRLLKQNYLDKLQGSSTENPIHDTGKEALSTLRLAEASLLKLDINQRASTFSHQIAVIGPTQAGKSTLVNYLTETELAGVSPLAGYTVHAHGYLVGQHEDSQWIETIFEGFQRSDTDGLDPDNYQQFSVQSCKGKPLKPVSPCVLWDTPDFDSVEAYGYSSAVIRTLALADIVILVVSREKYADKSVWDLLQLIQPLQKRLLICINKIDVGSEDALVESFRERFTQLHGITITPPVVTIPFVKNLKATAADLPAETRASLISHISELDKSVDREEQQKPVFNFIEQHWKPWTEPVINRHNAQKHWQSLINSTLEGAGAQYKRDYLNHPDNYDSFKRVLAQLLELLEIPGVAQSLVTARKFITWPARKLLNLGKEYTNKSGSDTEVATDMEQGVLSNICDNTLTSLITQAYQQSRDDPANEDWWNILGQKLVDSQAHITEEFEAGINDHQSEFEQDIENAAQDLYHNLEQQPKTLNSLRAARATADAAAIGLALKTGGIGMSDFVLAPAMLSVTTLLTESALGKYIDRIKARLRVEQFEAVDSRLFSGCLSHSLNAIAQEIQQSDNQSFISEKALSDAETMLRNASAQ